ncbi:primase-helicase zinc-binding domain-containing protein [Sulfitobacter sp. 1A16787]|uniref:DUF7146 domain-containing protein n=1 Tax=Sulfitobacter sp. 1A16787 TaxID=3368571 RepID=UPI0037455E66
MRRSVEDRMNEAKAIPILEAMERLGVAGLHNLGHEKVGPCPVCGGKDRFSINPTKGVFNCRRCDRGGDVIALAEHVLACDFLRALDFLVGEAAPEIDQRALEARRKKAREAEAKREAAAAEFRARAVEDARAIWARAVPGEGTAAQAYLAGRGIRFDAWPPSLRFIADHPMIKKAPGMPRAAQVHRGPALIGAIQNPQGRITAVHQTWIDPRQPGQKADIRNPATGEALPAKLVRGSKKGGAIRLGKVVDGCTLVMGEGIETTASALVAWRQPGAVYWVGIDLGNMAGRQKGRNTGLPDLEDGEAFVPPPEVAKLIYLQDGDSDPTTTRAKLLAGLRRAMAQNPDIEAMIACAPEGKDFNDLIN